MTLQTSTPLIVAFPFRHQATHMHSAALSKLNEALDIRSLPAGRYVLKLSAKAAGETREVFQIEFEKP